jgi:hypothetical protein
MLPELTMAFPRGARQSQNNYQHKQNLQWQEQILSQPRKRHIRPHILNSLQPENHAGHNIAFAPQLEEIQQNYD